MMMNTINGERLRQHIAHKLRAFRRDEDGSMIVFTLFLLVVMLVVGGMAVDFMRFESRRSALQGVTDRSVLAAADLDQKLDPANVVRDYFDKAGLSHALDGDPVVSPPSATSRTVTANGELTLNTYFLRLIGIDSLTAKTTATATEGVGNIEVSLVLDISGSMQEEIPSSGGVTRIARMREASSNFITTLLTDENADKISVSLVPYSEHVNPGEPIFDLLNTNSTHDYTHCVEFPASAYDQTNVDLNATYQQVQHYQYNPHIENGYYQPDITEPVCPMYSYETIVPLSQNATLLTTRINQLQPRAGTSIFLGLKWGVALLDPDIKTLIAALPPSMKDSAFADRPSPFATLDNPNQTRKYLVLMSDGQNDNSNRLLDEHYDTESERYHWAQENFPYYRATDLGYASYSNWVRTHYTATIGDGYMDSMCDAAKDPQRNITIFTIAMGTDSNPTEDARGKQQLENCASSPAMFYQTSGAELVEIFEDIAEQITDLRLTQ